MDRFHILAAVESFQPDEGLFTVIASSPAAFEMTESYREVRERQLTEIIRCVLRYCKNDGEDKSV